MSEEYQVLSRSVLIEISAYLPTNYVPKVLGDYYVAKIRLLIGSQSFPDPPSRMSLLKRLYDLLTTNKDEKTPLIISLYNALLFMIHVDNEQDPVLPFYLNWTLEALNRQDLVHLYHARLAGQAFFCGDQDVFERILKDLKGSEEVLEGLLGTTLIMLLGGKPQVKENQLKILRKMSEDYPHLKKAAR